MDDHLTEFLDENALALDEAYEDDTAPEQSPRVKFSQECGFVIYRRRIIIAVLSILLIVGLVISIAIVANSKNAGKRENVCLTPECIHTASAILKSLDPRIEPCDNFYNFTCGGYEASARIPHGKLIVSHFSTRDEDIGNQLKSVIEEQGGPEEPKHFRVTKAVYKKCMDTSAIEAAGLKPLRKTLKLFGSWPVLEGDDWKEEYFDWQESLDIADKLGYSTDQFIDFTVSVDWQDSKKYMLTLDRPSFGLPRDRLIKAFQDQDMLDPYLEYMVDIAKLLGADEDQVANELAESLEFEMRLAQLTLPDEKRANFTLLDNRMTLGEITKRFPSVNWVEYMNNLLPSTIRVDASEMVMVKELDFIGGLEKLLKKTKKRVLANYFVWRIVAESAKYLTKDMRDREMEYRSSLIVDSVGSSDPRWRQCLEILSETILSHSLNALYVRKYFNEDARQNVIDMVARIQKELIKASKKAEWMDEATRNKAVEKAASIISLVAYPIELLDDKELADFYAYIDFSPDDFLGNILDLERMAPDFLLKIFRNPVNKTKWFTHDISTTVNAFYNAQENSIVIPAAVLQGAFFSNDRPRYMNYGAIGTIIGHEFTHSFDTTGKQFDKEGNFVNWWTSETTEKYLKKTKCIIDQYSNYTVQSVREKVNGTKTLAENIADNGGVRKAYRAYKEWVNENGPEPKLPGLNYTQEQMFWISAGSLWCNRYSSDGVQYEFSPNAEHSPDRFRVIGSLSNLPEFAADFNCPSDSYMNPIHKCSLL